MAAQNWERYYFGHVSPGGYNTYTRRHSRSSVRVLRHHYIAQWAKQIDYVQKATIKTKMPKTWALLNQEIQYKCFL